MAWACRNCGILFITLWIIYAHVVALALLFTTCTPSHALHGSMLSYAWLHHMYSTMVLGQAPNRFSELQYIHACTNVNLKNSWLATLSLASGCTPLEVFTCGLVLLHLWNGRDFWRPPRSTTSLSEKSRAIERRASRGAIPQKGGAAAEVQGGWAPSLQLAWQRWWC